VRPKVLVFVDFFEEMIKKYRTSFSTGVVHSFTGTYEEASAYLELGLYIGLNGW
jgi:TatD DNase family protein